MHVCMTGRKVSSDPLVLVVRSHMVLCLIVFQPEVSLVVEAHVDHLSGVE